MRKFIQHIINVLAGIVAGSDTFLKKYARPAIEAMQVIKSLVGSEVVKNFTDATPAQWDNKLREKILKGLDVAIITLNIYQQCCDKATLEERISCFIVHLKTLTPAHREAIYHKAAVLLAKELAEKPELRNADMDALVQLAYFQLTADK